MPTPTDPFAARVASPCVRNCCLDENDICMGCGRHVDEITAWHQADSIEREKILALSQIRLQQRAARLQFRDT